METLKENNDSKKGILIGLIVLLAAIAGIVALTQADPEPIQDNLAVENSTSQETLPLLDGEYDIANDQSQLTWNASKKLGVGPHDGSVDIQSGSVTIVDGQVTNSQIVIDMTTIMTDDNGVGSEALDTHLKEDDFFAVSQYPTATLTANTFQLVAGNEYDVTGDLEIRGVTNPVTFTATIVTTGDMIMVAANLPIDRTVYEVGTNSKIADIGIEDEFTLEISLEGMVSNGQVELNTIEVDSE